MKGDIFSEMQYLRLRSLSKVFFFCFVFFLSETNCEPQHCNEII